MKVRQFCVILFIMMSIRTHCSAQEYPDVSHIKELQKKVGHNLTTISKKYKDTQDLIYRVLDDVATICNGAKEAVNQKNALEQNVEREREQRQELEKQVARIQSQYNAVKTKVHDSTESSNTLLEENRKIKEENEHLRAASEQAKANEEKYKKALYSLNLDQKQGVSEQKASEK